MMQPMNAAASVTRAPGLDAVLTAIRDYRIACSTGVIAQTEDYRVAPKKCFDPKSLPWPFEV